MNKEKRIRELIDKLNYYTKYYDLGQPKITDKKWDILYFELQKLENETNFYFKDSPTQSINYQVVNQLNKVKHNHHMLSLDKTKDINRIKSFIGNKDYICMAKMDGLTCSLKYLDGRLVSAETRGNGIEGEDILHNALVIKNIPNKIDYKDELIVDGEIICTYEDFKSFKNEYKNPRNFASGSIRLLDSNECAKRNLSFIAWDCIKGLDEFTLLGKLCKLLDLSFTTVPTRRDINNYDIEKLVENIKLDCQKLGYPIDGVVFKYNNCYEYNAAGRTDHHFKGGMAYKFYDEEYETTLIDVIWSMSRTGILTPVATFLPIDIDGTEVSRASLHNISIMEELNVYFKGQKIYVFKSNEIIPQIARTEDLYMDTTGIEFEHLHIPEVCSICGHKTEIIQENNSKVLYCGNPTCEGKLINRIDHFFGKKGLNARGISKTTIGKLIEWGWVNSISDVFKLESHKTEWTNKAGFGEKSVYNILQSIIECSNCDLESVIAAAGIPLIGRTVARDISARFSTYSAFREACIGDFDFSTLDGFGYEMNKSFKNYDYKELDYIVENFLNIKEKVKEIKEQKLEGLTFCVTGRVTKWKNRDELSAFITSLGGKVVGSVSANMDYLINNDINSTSAKNNKAKELGKQIIDEQTFTNLFDL